MSETEGNFKLFAATYVRERERERLNFYACKGAQPHTLFTGEREREREKEGDVEYGYFYF
jgi:hypothetical protein